MSEEDRVHQSVAGLQASLLRTQPRDYDMDDSHDLQRWPKLAPVLQDCEISLGEAYRRADSSARRYEAFYKNSVYLAAIFLAVVQLSLVMVEMPWWGRLGDFVAAIAAVGAVYALITRRSGISFRRLLEREKAERCRFLKFQFLLDVSLWSGLTSQARQDWLRSRVEQLSTLNKVDLKSWAEGKNEASEDAPPRVSATIDRQVVQDLVDYYEEKRLNYLNNQMNYFDAIAKRRHFLDKLARICSPLFFYLGILAALAYFTYNLSMHIYFDPNNYSERDALSSALLLSSACLPVVGVTVDQFRKAKGFGRSVSHIRAVSNEVKKLLDRLQKEADLRAKLEILHRTERTLQAERRVNLISEIDPWFLESGGKLHCFATSLLLFTDPHARPRLAVVAPRCSVEG